MTAEPKRIKCSNMAGRPGMRAVRRIAVYARVSTALETQQLSLESQMVGFQKKIAENPGWQLVEVYADEGITGTSVRRRGQFLKMIADAKAGKFDTIMTKSISRFARNTVECLAFERELKEHGVNIIFEKENLDTSTAISEMLLTVLAAFAQEESRSISENLKWGIRKRYERGQFRWCATYGYRLDEEKNIVIEPEEAEIVRMIFDLYRRGGSAPDIAEELNAAGVSSPRGKTWTPTTVLFILKSEKYVGDMILQKYFTLDHIKHKTVRNDKESVAKYKKLNTIPKYYL